MRTNLASFLRLGALATVMTHCPAAWAQPSGYALNFNGANDYVSLSLASPPASNYTLTAWVYLRTGGTFGGARMAVLSSTACGGSIEMLIRSQTPNATDPQYLELGRCGAFNGFFSTNPVPLFTWTHLAVTLSSNKVVSYYINGNPAGSFTDSNPSHDYGLGTAVNLGDNSDQRRFDGLLNNVQIWKRVLSPSEIQSNLNQHLTGGESGLHAWYPFNEGGGTSTADLATAKGGSDGTRVNNPAWFSLMLTVNDTSDNSAGSLRQAILNSVSGNIIAFAPDLSGTTITLTSGELLLNNNVTLDASALSGGIILNSHAGSRVFEIASGATVVLGSLTLTNGFANAGGAILNAGSLTANRCTITGSSVSSGGGGGGIYNNLGTLTLNECTVAGNLANVGGGAGGGIFNLSGGAPVILNHCTVSGNAANTGGGLASFNLGSNNVTFFNSIVAGNSAGSNPDVSDTTPSCVGPT
ncbi:MAG: LamG domain-containing protein [Verrucomicrobia bacterium]|nr:LamG domain-containing protein [Verrucomicrobiota bacterium]